VRALAKQYGVPFKADAVKTIISSLVGAFCRGFRSGHGQPCEVHPLIGWTQPE